jgi:nitrite reductase/ring-hydroxylating ferredoxin subunit
MAEERRASRRDLFRLFGRSLADAVGKKVPAVPAAPSPPPVPVPATEVPVERERMVVDLALHPILPGTGKRFRAEGAREPILLARVTKEHLAAVSGDCPHCGGALSFSGERDAVLCPAGAAAFRLDGGGIEGPGHLRLATYAVRRLGPRVEVDLAPA